VKATLAAAPLYFKCFVDNIPFGNRVEKMRATFSKVALGLFCASLLCCGCATSTVETRKQERYGVYSELTPEMKSLVDQGKIKVGMPMDAVYIALGKPSQILTGESSKGNLVTWLYHGTYLQEYRYWSYHPYCFGYRYYYPAPYLEYDYYPRSYVRAEVTFENGLVKEWRSLPQPGY
jgi:hypothetical protein